LQDLLVELFGQDINIELKMFLRGYKRFIQDRKQAGLHPVVEGKRHLSFVGYVSLFQPWHQTILSSEHYYGRLEK
jgi:hypothetical protein